MTTVNPPVVLPPVPTIPTTWSPATVATLLGGVAAFILGVLTAAGVVLPGNVSSEVQTVMGSITAIAGALTPLLALLSKHSVQKTAIRSGWPVAESLKI